MQATGFDRRYMVKHYLTRIVRSDGRTFDVLETGDPKYVLFVPILGHSNGIGGWAADVQIPVKRTDLTPEVARLIPRP